MRLDLHGIHKRYGPNHANDAISFTIESGTIHGLLGENGAGKSTLMNIVAGLTRPDAGELRLDGRPLTLGDPVAARRAGIGMLHQDPLDFPPFTVLENLLFGREGGWRLDRDQALADLRHWAGEFDFALAPDTPMASLTTGERQQAELVRLLSLGARVLILDEPTTGLSAPQKAKLFATLRRLAAEGRTLILVTHKLEDAEELCRRVTVLRRGRVVGEPARPFTADQLVRLMFGESFPGRAATTIRLGDPVLELTEFAVAHDRFRLTPISLNVAAGEVIGLAGIEGSGQRSFLRACAGLEPPVAGEMRVDGAVLTRRCYDRFLARGVMYLPAGRLEEGLVPGLNLAEHFVLARRGGGFLIDWRTARDHAEERLREHRIRGLPTSRVEALSGGNQQRALLALLPADLRVLLLEHPTRGLDLESSRWIWSRLRERRERGAAILFASADLDELLEQSDRILVFSGERTPRLLRARDTSVTDLGEWMGGGSSERRASQRGSSPERSGESRGSRAGPHAALNP